MATEYYARIKTFEVYMSCDSVAWSFVADFLDRSCAEKVVDLLRKSSVKRLYCEPLIVEIRENYCEMNHNVVVIYMQAGYNIQILEAKVVR